MSRAWEVGDVSDTGRAGANGDCMNAHSHGDYPGVSSPSIDQAPSAYSKSHSCCKGAALEGAQSNPAPQMSPGSAATQGSCCTKPSATASGHEVDPVCAMHVDPAT